MAADGQISLCSICPTRHPEGDNVTPLRFVPEFQSKIETNPCLASAIVVGFDKKLIKTLLNQTENFLNFKFKKQTIKK